MEKKNGKFVAKPFPQELAKKLREKFDAIASNCQDDLPVVDLQINLDLMKLAGAQKINGPCAQFLKPQKQYASNAKLFEEMLIQCKDAVVSLCIGTALGPEFRKCMSEHEKKGDLEVACAKALDAVPPLPKEWNGEFMKAQALAMHQACEADLNTFKPKRNYILASHYSKLRPQCQQTLANLFPDLKTVEAHGGDNSAPIK